MASVEPRREDTVPSRVAPTRADSVLGDMSVTDQGPAERQWMVRLENGETKTCRELATLQQWIVAGVATREALISRSGKTWKRLGDITELHQYFVIADEARNQRAVKATPSPKPQAPTMLGIGGANVSAAGGTILPDDDADDRSTGNFRARPRTTPPPPPPPRSSTAPQNKPNPLAQTELAPSGPRGRTKQRHRRGRFLGCPAPRSDLRSVGERANRIKGERVDGGDAAGSAPFVGKLSGMPGQRAMAFSGRVRAWIPATSRRSTPARSGSTTTTT